ncbi:ferredoxin [Mycobacterium sp. Y57]|uniref:ferredoxin n=1 Tax=Mycolicibacterium xanthum TaxID=2796469 RepID=UPI001C84EA24|nr:ferredoxin [Mycolicibacterium xanthum]MBX7431954.1 ferredoxin [Mycolicibacterium xanthum]
MSAETGGTWRVSADRELCIQAGNCAMVAGDVFDQDDDGIVVVLAEQVSGEQADRAREAVRLCPASALRLAAD